MQELEDKRPSKSEEIFLKILWDSPEDISMLELAEALRTLYQKDYARTTIVTFLARLAAKGFVTTYRKGRLSYVKALKSREEYLQWYFSDMLKGWFHGDRVEVLTFMIESELITIDDKAEV